MFLIGYIIAFILYMVITLYGINVMRSVVTEKSSRVVELLVASAKPRALMAGKVLGVGGAGRGDRRLLRARLPVLLDDDAAIGATVSNEQDSQQAQTPITMFLII